MPQLVKGGKHVYGWSRVSNLGKTAIPYDALVEYGLLECSEVLLVPGGKRSGGFGVTSAKLLENSIFSSIIAEKPQLKKLQTVEGVVVEIRGRNYCWVKLSKDGSIVVPEETLKKYGVNLGDSLLSVRGSNVAIGFLVKGPIIEEAKKHSDVNAYF